MKIRTQDHISPNHLIRLFRKDIQTTPNQFWDRLRVEHAVSRLRQPDIRIKEVAIDLGFKHLSHFSKWFKRHTGKSPQSVRQKQLALNLRRVTFPEACFVRIESN